MPRESVYTIPAKPTLYRGCLFDSKLEATWAALFDEAGWSWGYHPAIFDFPKLGTGFYNPWAR